MRRMFYTIALLLLVGCAKAQSSSRRAEEIPSPRSGYTCFVILDEDGKAVGGNCVRTE